MSVGRLDGFLSIQTKYAVRSYKPYVVRGSVLEEDHDVFHHHLRHFGMCQCTDVRRRRQIDTY